MRRRGTLLLDLRRDREDLWKGIHFKRKKEIRHAQKIGFTIQINPPDDTKKAWLELFIEHQSQLGFQVNRSYIEHLLGLDTGGGCLLFTISHEQQLLSGELFVMDNARSGGGGAMQLLYSATTKEAALHRLAGLGHALLVWHTIVWAQNHEFVEYDFGGWNCYRPGLEGVNKWKESFGGNVWWWFTQELPLKEQLEFEKKEILDPSKAIIWIDDGHISIYDFGPKFFETLGIKPILALVTGKMGQLLDVSNRQNYRLMTTEQAACLVKEGWEIASHGVSHRPLTFLSLEECEDEFVNSKQWIIDNLGVTPTKFAPPYSQISPEQLKLAYKFYDYVRPVIPPRPPQPGGINAIIHIISRNGRGFDSAFAADPGFLNLFEGKMDMKIIVEHKVDAYMTNLLTYRSDEAVNYYSRPGLQEGEQLAFKEFLQPGKVLDLGCGAGRITNWLSKAGCDVIGIDPSEPMINRARELYPRIEFKLGDAEELFFPDGSFDYVIFGFNGIDCLYPEKIRFKALNEIRRVLKSGGLFIFSSHNIAWLEQNRNRVEEYEPPYYLYKAAYGPTYLYFISANDQRKQLEETGFELLKIYNDAYDPWLYYVAKKKNNP